MSENRRKRYRYNFDNLTDDKLQIYIIVNDENIKIKPDNLSTAGINFKLNDEQGKYISKNSSIRFKFILNNGEEISALGKLVWKTKIGSSGDDYYSIGFHLFIAEEENQKALEDFLSNLN